MSETVRLLPDAAKLRGSDFNALRAQVLSQRVTGAAGVLPSGFGGGSTLSALGLPPVIRRQPRLPFAIYESSDGATLKIAISNGTVNGISPTFTGASPSGELEDDPPPLLTITATTYFWLKVVATFGSPDTYVVTVENTSTFSPPDPEAITGTDFTSCLFIGYVTVTSGAITAISQSIFSSLGVESYGNINNWWAYR